ncbi:biopolymer transporter ExbD, partial [candidate division KSB1 bacterium]|nr:biopolymer transporter ExbD [candidate division KSB1 bacterium]
MNLKMEQKLLDSFSLSSLTDIVMLLLIFFLLSSTFIIQPGIKVNLPEADSSEKV